MPGSIFEIGSKISLKLLKKGGLFTQKNLDETEYGSYISHVISEREIVVAAPLKGTVVLGVNRNDIYSIKFYTKTGIYSSTALVTKTGREDNISVVTLKILSKLERFQRREYYRLACKFNIAYACLTEDQLKLYTDLKAATTDGRKKILKEQLKMEDIHFQKGIMVDISGGGTKFYADIPLEKDTNIVIFVESKEISESVPYLLGTVVVTGKNLENRKKVYENKIKFINISNEEREKIIRYIFAAEREKIGVGQ